MAQGLPRGPCSFFCPAFRFLTEKQFQIVIHRADARDAEILDQHVGHVRRQERRERRPQMDVLDAQMQQRQQDDNGFLLVPGDVERQRQVVDVFSPKISFSFRAISASE